jgi:hypothetical protein
MALDSRFASASRSEEIRPAPARNSLTSNALYIGFARFNMQMESEIYAADEK